jgi:hypothetical protein
MIFRAALMALTILSSGCAPEPDRIDTPADLVGEISRPVFTGWYIDYCNGGGLTKVFPNCAQVGGEIYKVSLLGERTQAGFPIAFPAHALSSEWHARVHVHLVKAPEAFARETGIAYLAREWSDA